MPSRGIESVRTILLSVSLTRLLENPLGLTTEVVRSVKMITITKGNLFCNRSDSLDYIQRV